MYRIQSWDPLTYLLFMATRALGLLRARHFVPAVFLLVHFFVDLFIGGKTHLYT